MPAAWSSQLVEELLFRQYIKGEDVSTLLPPPPTLAADQYMEKYEQSTKMLSSYVRNGPAATLSSQNVNTASRIYGATPVKGQTSFSRAANAAPAAAGPAADPRTQVNRTPNGKERPSPVVDSPIPAPPNAATRQGNAPAPAQARKNRVEWPASVPTNASLKSSSRSKVAHLTARRVAAQETVDPDLIFAQNPGELPLHAIFAKFPKALDTLAAIRGASGDWRNDTFSTEEENQYKRDLGFVHVGPSQCAFSRSNLLHK
ncbi:putative chromosomal passenger protein [Trypanosoma conorhini]|uniref:Putative chromosomal passenger protein n=1 Tax=Trypanosoma conorhini TaxID=83891 RepID=A0A422NND4_9TRYP|nr:putative chromosomal passenger protein [Trypanosoma conorhini]RNF06975.1 putative chromosomal passenger protein [Trypanosoma conorhini]